MPNCLDMGEYWGTSLIRNCNLPSTVGLCLGPYGGPRGGGVFLMSEVPLYGSRDRFTGSIARRFPGGWGGYGMQVGGELRCIDREIQGQKHDAHMLQACGLGSSQGGFMALGSGRLDSRLESNKEEEEEEVDRGGGVLNAMMASLKGDAPLPTGSAHYQSTLDAVSVYSRCCIRSYQSTLDAVYVYVVPWSEFPIVPSYPHYPQHSHVSSTLGGSVCR